MANLINLFATGFSPKGLPSLVAWYDFSNISTLWKNTALTTPVTADADLIQGVRDLSGTGNHLTRNPGPGTYRVNAQNGKSAGRFVGTAAGLQAVTNNYAQPLTTFITLKATATGASNTGAGTGSGTHFIFGWFQAAGQISIYANNSALTGAVDRTGAWLQQSGLFNGASSQQWVGGTSEASGNAGTQGLTGIAVGEEDGTTGFTGDIGEVIICNAVLSTANRQATEAYLKNKWGTP